MHGKMINTNLDISSAQRQREIGHIIHAISTNDLIEEIQYDDYKLYFKLKQNYLDKA